MFLFSYMEQIGNFVSIVEAVVFRIPEEQYELLLSGGGYREQKNVRCGFEGYARVFLRDKYYNRLNQAILVCLHCKGNLKEK